MCDISVDSRRERVYIYQEMYLKKWGNSGKIETKEYKNLLKFVDLIKIRFEQC